MPAVVLSEREKTCKRCEGPHMEPTEHVFDFRATNEDLLKMLVKCRACGRISFILRPKAGSDRSL